MQNARHTPFMSDANGGDTPQATATAEPTVITEAAPVAPSSSTTQESFTDRVRKAKSPLETRQLIAELKKNPLTPEALQAAKAPKVIPPPVETTEEPAATEETPASEETIPAAETTEEAAPEATEEGATTTEEEPAEGESPFKVPTAKRLRVQLPEDDEFGRTVTAFLQRNRDWSMSQAIEAAQKRLGIAPQAAKETAPTPEQQTESTLPQTVEETDALIKSLRADRLKAKTELRFEDEAPLSDQIEDLLSHKLTLARQAERQEIQQQAVYDQTYQSSEAQAVDLYPLAADRNSEFGQRMIEIEEALKTTGDPLYYDAKKPLRIAQMVANEMAIAPRRKGVTTPVRKTAAPIAPAPKKGMVPSGSSRTTAPAANQPPAIMQEIRAIRSVKDLRAMRAKLGLPQH